ncbi:hypothetical protein [uncultured Rikenella sp.]|uniref:hypothetical protein n=1 Tax=uncultured Rikenella sp. TaxID=368003 RepID=UPI0026086814|nr:hypothetical protein [uncultured Rikenella sp.]
MKKKLLFGAFAALALGAGIATAVGTAQSARAQSSKLSFGNVETMEQEETCILPCPDDSEEGYRTIGCYTLPCAVDNDMTMRCGNFVIMCYN